MEEAALPYLPFRDHGCTPLFISGEVGSSKADRICFHYCSFIDHASKNGKKDV